MYKILRCSQDDLAGRASGATVILSVGFTIVSIADKANGNSHAEVRSILFSSIGLQAAASGPLP